MAYETNIKVKGDFTDVNEKTKDLAENLKDVKNEAKKTDTGLKDVADNGGAIAILDRLTGGLATTLKDAYESSKLFNGSLKATRSALIATGIGAFLVALGAVVAYWDDIVELITQANARLEKQVELTKSNTSLLDDQLKILDKQIELGEQQGKNTEALQKQRISIIEKLQDQNKIEIGLLKLQLVRLKSTATEIGLWETAQIAAETFLFGASAGQQRAADLARQRALEINNLEKAILAATLAGLDLELTLFKALNPESKAPKIDPRDKETQVGGRKVQGFQGESKGFFEALKEDPEVLLAQAKEKLIKESEEGLTKFLQDQGLKRQAQAEVIANSRIQLEENAFSLINAIAEQGGAVAKGAAIAQVVRDQVQAVSGIISNTAAANAKAAAASPLTGGQPWVTFNTIAAGLGIGASVAGATTAIKDILAENKNPSNGGAVNLAGGGSQAPAFELVDGTASNQIQRSLETQNNPVRAYVTSGDVSTVQELDRSIQAEASLG